MISGAMLLVGGKKSKTLSIDAFEVRGNQSWCTHLALIQEGKLTVQGPQEQVLDQVVQALENETADFHVCTRDLFSQKNKSGKIKLNRSEPDRSGPDKPGLDTTGLDPSERIGTGLEHGSPDRVELVCLTDGSAGYGGEPVFEHLSLTVCQGDHTLIT